MKTKEDIIETLQKNRVSLRKHGITRYQLFGSFARGEQRADSDVDLIADVAEANVHEAEKYLTDLLGLPVQVLPEEIIQTGRLKNHKNFTQHIQDNKPASVYDFLSELNKNVLLLIRQLKKMSVERIFADDEQDHEAQDVFLAIKMIVVQMGDVCHSLKKKFPSFVQSHPELKVDLIYQQRNRISHEYWNTDVKILKENILHEIDQLHAHLQKLLHEKNV